MRMVDLILKKREGFKLSREELDFIVKNYTNGSIPDYQIAAWAMAVFFKGMDPVEIADLTTSMVKSGEEVDLSPIQGIKVDKHSTGGVGDTTTLILAPLVAAAGVPVAKMSGRGLGHTGGTIDKLESIPGFHTELTKQAFFSNVNEFKLAVVGQSGNLAPADKKLYSLRDVTATVDSIPLIASSIMSKKIASGADAIVLDVKMGNGAFMKTLERATKLGQTMVDIGKHVGRRTIAVISDMNQPLGFAVGNSLEVEEAIATLKGEGPTDLTELCLVLGAHMCILAEKQPDFDSAYQSLKKILETGEAISKFKEFVSAQGGDSSIIDDPGRLPKAQYQVEVKAEVSGYVHHIQAEEIGNIAMKLGAGRKTKEDTIDLAAGIVLRKKVGDPVAVGDLLAILHTNKTGEIETLQQELIAAYEIEKQKVDPPSLIYHVIV